MLKFQYFFRRYAYSPYAHCAEKKFVSRLLKNKASKLFFLNQYIFHVGLFRIYSRKPRYCPINRVYVPSLQYTLVSIWYFRTLYIIFLYKYITIITVRGQHREKPPRSGLQPSRAVQQPPLTSPRPPMTSSRPLMTSSRPPRSSGGSASGSQTLPSSPTVFASHSPVPQVRSSFC
jgi:hypothetical protein